MPALLDRRWSDLLRDRPKLNLYDAARELGVSEAELLAADCGSAVVRLEGDWAEFIKELPKLGRVQCVTRNDAFTHERLGEFRSIEFFGEIGVVLGDDIDLRIFLHNWHHGFAIVGDIGNHTLKSFRFFDAGGSEIHRVTLQKEGSLPAFQAITERFTSSNQAPVQIVTQPPVTEALPDSEIDIAGFQDAWLSLEDTVHFADILREFKVTREQGLRLAPKGYARQVKSTAIRSILEDAAEIELPIMIFVRTSGCIQIHSGSVTNVKMFGGDRLNILDSDFDLHVFLPLIHTTWVVRKPTIDGDITSLEIFNIQGENVALLFGKRGYGMSEYLPWKTLLNALP